jgi:hypothetical protein
VTGAEPTDIGECSTSSENWCASWRGPYYETRGFPKEFVLVENQLCARDETGRPVLDKAGHPVLDPPPFLSA